MRYNVKLIGKLPDGTECEALMSIYAAEDHSDFEAKVKEAVPIAPWLQKLPGWPDVPEGVQVEFEKAEAIEQPRPDHRKRVMGPGPGMLGGMPGRLMPMPLSAMPPGLQEMLGGLFGGGPPEGMGMIMEIDDRPFKPDWYSPPGDTIKTVLEERKMPLEAFAQQMGMPLDQARRLLDGSEPLTGEIAGQLATVLGSTAEFWLRREATYREDKARIDGERGKLNGQ